VIRSVLLVAAVLAGAAPAAAQSSIAPSLAPSTAASAAQSAAPASGAPAAGFLTRALFHMGAEHLTTDDPQFVWEANFGGEIDFVDWGSGRATFVANYQVMLGEEFKAFDPNQGNYILGFAGSARLAGTEVSGVFHHESRHLSDRPKRTAVDWNMVGARVQRRTTLGALFLHAEGQILGVIQKSYVDYSWEAGGRLRSDVVLRPGVGVLAAVTVRALGVDGSRDRATQTGVRAEGGVRFDGEMGAVELFAGVERRVDPAPLEFGTMNWVTFGFRLMSR
jgi:hypothetical protein